MLTVFVTVLLLNCSNALCQSDACSVPTGGMEHADTNVTIGISYIHKANEKLIELNYLKSIDLQKDSIIFLKEKYISAQESIIENYKSAYISATELNDDLAANISKQRRKTRMIAGCSGGIIAGLIVGLIFK